MLVLVHNDDVTEDEDKLPDVVDDDLPVVGVVLESHVEYAVLGDEFRVIHFVLVIVQDLKYVNGYANNPEYEERYSYYQNVLSMIYGEALSLHVILQVVDVVLKLLAVQ